MVEYNFYILTMTLNELGQLTVSIGDMITQIPRRTCFLTAAAADQHVSLIAESLATQYSLPPCAIWVDGCLLSPNAVISEVYNGQYAEAVAMRHRSVWRADYGAVTLCKITSHASHAHLMHLMHLLHACMLRRLKHQGMLAMHRGLVSIEMALAAKFPEIVPP